MQLYQIFPILLGVIKQCHIFPSHAYNSEHTLKTDRTKQLSRMFVHFRKMDVAIRKYSKCQLFFYLLCLNLCYSFVLKKNMTQVSL